MTQEQKRYQRNFNARLQPTKSALREVGFVFVSKEYFDNKSSKNKLSPLAEGPYKIIYVGTCALDLPIKDHIERVSRDRVVDARTTLEKLSSHILKPPPK